METFNAETQRFRRDAEFFEEEDEVVKEEHLHDYAKDGIKNMTENEISAVILDAAIFVHRAIGGPGLLESYYEVALARELMDRGLFVETQKPIPIIFKGAEIGNPFRLDMLVEKKVIVECKATENDHPIFKAQVLTYLRLTGLKLGLLINFGLPRILDGYCRVANGLDSPSPPPASPRTSPPLR